MIAEDIKDCVIYDGKGWLDGNGGISSLDQVYNVPSAEHCMQNACQDNSQCIAFTYIASIERCDLKTEKQAVTLGDFTSGVMSAKSPKSCHSGRFH